MCGNPGMCQRDSAQTGPGMSVSRCVFIWHRHFGVLLQVTEFCGGGCLWTSRAP